MSDHHEIIARLKVYLETIDEHMALITRMRDDGVISQETYEQEIAMFAGEHDMVDETLNALIRHHGQS